MHLFVSSVMHLLIVSSAPPESMADTPNISIEPHRFVAASGATCDAHLGTFTVPLDRSDPAGETITLRFVRFPTTSATPGPPVVYLAGGPGGSGIATARGSRFPLFMALRAVGDVIAFDQRGTGRSDLFNRLTDQAAVPTEGALTVEWMKNEYGNLAGAAWGRLADAGFDPNPLNTRENAADLESLRLALGENTLRLWAISYGTHLALATMREYPESIQSAVLAGVEGLDDTFKHPSQVEAPIAALSVDIARDPTYGPLIPDFEALMRRVFERAEQAPFPVEVDVAGDGRTTTVLIGRLELERITWERLVRRDRMAILPKAFLALEAGAPEMLRLVAQNTRDSIGLGSAMSVAMDCASGVSPHRRDRIERETPGSLFKLSMNLKLDAIRNRIDVPDLGESFRAPFRSDIPVLMLSGEYDVRTPASNAQRVLASFPNARHIRITRAGHDDDLWLSSPLIGECVIDFFRGREPQFRKIELPPIVFE